MLNSITVSIIFCRVEHAVKILGVKIEDVIIVFQEEPHGNWYASGVRL